MAKNKSKIKKILGGIATAGLTALAASKFRKKKLSKSIENMDDAGLGVSPLSKYIKKTQSALDYVPGSAADPMAEAALESSYKHGGRVKGGGVAKRGLGRAFKGGR